MAATDSRRVERRRQEIGCYRSEDGAKNSVVKDGVRRGRKFRKEGTTDPSIVNTKSGGGKREKEADRTVYNSQSRRRSQEVHCKTGEKKEGSYISLSTRLKRKACLMWRGKKEETKVYHRSFRERIVLRKEEDLGGEVGGRN